MQDSFTIHIDKEPLNRSIKDDSVYEQHPSGFMAEIYTEDDIFKGRIERLNFIFGLFSINIFPDVMSDDPKLEKFAENLKKLFNFFKNVDPSFIIKLIGTNNCFYFGFGRYDNQPQFSEETDRHLDKHKNWPFFLIDNWDSSLYSNCFQIDDFHKKLNEAYVYEEPNGESVDTILFLKDLEEETIKKTFENILTLNKVSQEIQIAKNDSAQEYFDDNKPWELLKQ